LSYSLSIGTCDVRTYGGIERVKGLIHSRRYLGHIVDVLKRLRAKTAFLRLFDYVMPDFACSIRLRACAKINSDLFSAIWCNSKREESNVDRG